MYPKSIFVLATILALVSMACGITFNLPVTEVKTGPTVIEDISIPLPEGAGPVNLDLNFGAGEFDLEPGDSDFLVSGTATYNVQDLKPEVTLTGNRVQIETGNLEINGIPTFRGNYKNEWKLAVAPVPMHLEIHAGAYQGRFELGGLSLLSLRIADGAADVNVGFSEPNQVEMDTLRYETGASEVSLSGLANANFGEMTFKGGAGNYSLDFSGELLRDATVTVDAGLSSVKLVVPEGTAARVFLDGGLANVDLGSQWEKTSGGYTLAGEGPRLTINVNIGAGNLELRTR